MAGIAKRRFPNPGTVARVAAITPMSARLRATTTERENMNTSTWRRLGAFAVLPLLGASLAACGSGGDSGSDSKSITFAYQIANPNAKSVFATLAEEYEKAHK